MGYRTVRDAGNVPPLSRPDAVSIVVEENHGYSISPTFVSLNEAYMICVPSGDPQTASSDWNISSIEENTKNYKFTTKNLIVVTKLFFFTLSMDVQCNKNHSFKSFFHFFCTMLPNKQDWIFIQKMSTYKRRIWLNIWNHIYDIDYKRFFFVLQFSDWLYWCWKSSTKKRL